MMYYLTILPPGFEQPRLRVEPDHDLGGDLLELGPCDWDGSHADLTKHNNPATQST